MLYGENSGPELCKISSKASKKNPVKSCYTSYQIHQVLNTEPFIESSEFLIACTMRVHVCCTFSHVLILLVLFLMPSVQLEITDHVLSNQ